MTRFDVGERVKHSPSSPPIHAASKLSIKRVPSRKFSVIDSYVHERMAMLASDKYGLHGRNWATRFTYGWMTDLGIYRLSGTVRYWAASA